MNSGDLQGRNRFTFGSGVVATRVELRLRKGIPFDEWRRVLDQALTMGTAAAWWIGDALAHGEWHYGTQYREVLEELEAEYDRIRDYAYVAGNVPAAIRRADLTFTHHRIVAKLVPKEQEKWLERAARERWTKRRLIEELDKAKSREAEETAGRPAVLEQLRFTYPAEQVARWTAAAERVESSLQDWTAAVLDLAAAESERA